MQARSPPNCSRQGRAGKSRGHQSLIGWFRFSGFPCGFSCSNCSSALLRVQQSLRLFRRHLPRGDRLALFVLIFLFFARIFAAAVFAARRSGISVRPAFAAAISAGTAAGFAAFDSAGCLISAVAIGFAGFVATAAAVAVVAVSAAHTAFSASHHRDTVSIPASTGTRAWGMLLEM